MKAQGKSCGISRGPQNESTNMGAGILFPLGFPPLDLVWRVACHGEDGVVRRHGLVALADRPHEHHLPEKIRNETWRNLPLPNIAMARASKDYSKELLGPSGFPTTHKSNGGWDPLFLLRCPMGVCGTCDRSTFRPCVFEIGIMASATKLWPLWFHTHPHGIRKKHEVAMTSESTTNSGPLNFSAESSPPMWGHSRIDSCAGPFSFTFSKMGRSLARAVAQWQRTHQGLWEVGLRPC